MTTFDKREQGFEAKFIHDEEIGFKTMARCNKLLGNWAAIKLGLTGDAAVSYANKLVTENLENRSLDEIKRKVASDLEPRGISQAEIASKIQEYFDIARKQIEAGQ